MILNQLIKRKINILKNADSGKESFSRLKGKYIALWEGDKKTKDKTKNQRDIPFGQWSRCLYDIL